jgi:hypothetical protein
MGILGFEPRPRRLKICRSNQLSYIPSIDYLGLGKFGPLALGNLPGVGGGPDRLRSPFFNVL